jgi:hypothetical protein
MIVASLREGRTLSRPETDRFRQPMKPPILDRKRRSLTTTCSLNSSVDSEETGFLPVCWH